MRAGEGCAGAQMVAQWDSSLVGIACPTSRKAPLTTYAIRELAGVGIK
jgi:hypothetical protein